MFAISSPLVRYLVKCNSWKYQSLERMSLYLVLNPVRIINVMWATKVNLVIMWHRSCDTDHVVHFDFEHRSNLEFCQFIFYPIPYIQSFQNQTQFFLHFREISRKMIKYVTTCIENAFKNLTLGRINWMRLIFQSWRKNACWMK